MVRKNKKLTWKPNKEKGSKDDFESVRSKGKKHKKKRREAICLDLEDGLAISSERMDQ